jgi:dienelactone hydrolase
VVFASDALGWGDRECNGYESQQALASNLFNLGSSWAGLVAVEDRAAAAFVASLPFVDSSRVAAVGHSFGAYRSWQLAALSDDVTLCAASCSFGTVAGLMAPGGNRTRGQSAFCMTHPGISRLMDFPDVVRHAAQSPVLNNGRMKRLPGRLRPGCVRQDRRCLPGLRGGGRLPRRAPARRTRVLDRGPERRIRLAGRRAAGPGLRG